MKASVDESLCIGCGLCESICPKVFKLNSENISEVICDITNDTLADAREAEAQCPVSAITIK
ncbi:MAG: ferredoxin [Vallitaleaceae bacterium]|nr:ferredoxin [Vallitaleaceae bacterium]